MTNPQEEVLRAWENIKLISNPAWVTKPDDYIKANQRLWSWKCAQECHDHLYREVCHQHFDNDNSHDTSGYQIDMTCRIRSVRDTIPQSRLAKYYGNFYYDESRESLFTGDDQLHSQTQSKSLSCSNYDVTECWMLPEVDYWYKMLTENENVFSSQDSKILINDVSICAQKVDTIQQVASQMSILTTSIYETSCLFNEKIFAEDPRESYPESEYSAKTDTRDLPKWITYLDQIYPDLQLSLHFLQKIPSKTFSLYSAKIYDQQIVPRANSMSKFPINLNTDDEKKLHENLFSSCIQNIWKCDYCSSKNCAEKSHINVKKPTFYFTPESISALQKSILDFRTQIKSYYNSEVHTTQRNTINNDEKRKIRHDKRRFKNKAINKTKSQKETKYLDNSFSKSVGALPENNTENESADNRPNQILKEFFDHFRNAANKNYVQGNVGVCSNSYNAHCASLENHLTSFVGNNQGQVFQSQREGNAEFLKNNDKTMKSVSSQTYANEIAANRAGNSKSFKNNRSNQNKTNTKKKVSTDKNGNFSKYGGYSPKTSQSTSFANIKNDDFNTTDGKKTNQNSFGQNNKSKNGQSSKKKTPSKRKPNQNNNENLDRFYSNTPKKITILNKSHANAKHDEENKSKKHYATPSIEPDKLTANTEGEPSAINEHHNLSKACGGEAFIQNYTLAQCYEKKCVVFKEDPVLSYRKRLYSDVLSGNSSVLLLNNDNCNISQINSFKIDETHNTNKPQCADVELNQMVILNSSSPSNAVDVSSIEAQLEKLEIEAMEQYKTSDESIDKKFDELEKEALAQYVDTSDSFTSCKDESETCITPGGSGVNGKGVNNKNVKDSADGEKTKPLNSFVIYAKASGNKKSKNVKKCKTQK